MMGPAFPAMVCRKIAGETSTGDGGADLGLATAIAGPLSATGVAGWRVSRREPKTVATRAKRATTNPILPAVWSRDGAGADGCEAGAFLLVCEVWPKGDSDRDFAVKATV